MLALLAVLAGGTTIAVSPGRAAPGDPLRVSGTSDCQLMHVSIEYRDHAAEARFGGVDTEARFDPATGRYVYALSWVVPNDARPGQDATVQAEQACGTAEDGFPPSPEIRVRIVAGPAGLAVSPPRVRPGGLVTVTGRCAGGGAEAGLSVRWPGGRRTVPAPVAQGMLRVTFRLDRDAAAGAGQVTLETGCPGTALPAVAQFTVRASRSETAAASSTPSPTAPAAPAAPAEPAAPTASPGDAAGPAIGGPVGPAALVAGVLAVLLVGGVGIGSVLAWRRRH